MTISPRIFRNVWRINAVLILIAAGAITVGIVSVLVGELGSRTARTREQQQGVQVVADPDKHLTLEGAEGVPGSNVMRANLTTERGGEKFGSSGYSSGEKRNILFIEPGQKLAHWLLTDNDHVIADTAEIDNAKYEEKGRRIATAVLVQPPENDSRESSDGALILFDASGKTVVHVADGVRRIHHAALSNGDITLLYERNRHFVTAVFDPATLSKRSEQEIEIPQIR